MKILLLGKYGQLGWELRRALAPAGGVTALDYPEIDLVNLSLVREAVAAHQPEVIVNATAYTAVDRAESEPELALAINAHAPLCWQKKPCAWAYPLSTIPPIMSSTAAKAAHTWKAILQTLSACTVKAS